MNLPKLAGLEIGLYKPGEEGAILDCMRVCFNFQPEIERWRHLYLDNPAGDAVILLARDRGRVVSHTTFLPRRIKAFGKQGLVGHSTDSMTLPEWRSKGIKSMLSAELRRIAQERGLMAVFSYANKQHLPILIKHEGRRPVEPFPVMVRPLKPVRAGLVFVKKWLPLPLMDQSVIQNTDTPDCGVAGPIPDESTKSSIVFPPGSNWSSPRFDDRHTELFNAAEAISPIAMVRDSAHLIWRYSDAPGSPYLQQDISTGQML